MTADLHVWWSHPPAERAGRPVVVALHGRGADERSLAVLAPDLPDGVVVACPRAPVTEGDGAAWWQMHAIGYPVAASLATTRTLLLAWLDDEVGDVDVALLFGGALPWSTSPPTEVGRLHGVSVLLSWGEDDGVMPGDLLERSARWLQDRSGADVVVHVEPGLAHFVDTAQVERARVLLSRVLRHDGRPRA